MLDKSGFNKWASSYDEYTRNSEKNNEYPFAGYSQILYDIYSEVSKREKSSVLDIGFGTAILTSRLYNDRHNITGLDFSSEMIKVAKSKMPEAQLTEWDMNIDLPVSLTGKAFDFIIFTYSIHHISIDKQVDLLNKLLSYLRQDGTILIGDVMFDDIHSLTAASTSIGDKWDDEEHYVVIDEFTNKLLINNDLNIEFVSKSFCSGVLKITKQ